MRNRTLIILGMHRSGTSLVTKWLHSCGLEIGESLLGPGLGNIEGHFEDTEFYKMHLEILRDNNLNDSGIMEDEISTITPYHKEKIKGIIAVKNRLFDKWGWKDPRTCLFLDTYHEILPGAYYLVVLRDYSSVVVSLIKRTFAETDIVYNTKKGYFSKLAWFGFRRKHQYQKFCHKHAAFFLRVWLLYNKKILAFINTLPAEKYLVLNYSMLNTMDKDIISHLNKQWGFSLYQTRFADIYNENLFSKPFDVAQYIADKELIISANDLTARLTACAGIQNDKQLTSAVTMEKQAG